MMHFIRASRHTAWSMVVGLASLMLTGCSVMAPEPPPPLEDSADLMPDLADTPLAKQGGGLFSPQASGFLFSDSRALRTGDVLTVQLEESTQASKKSASNLGKSSKVDVPSPSLFGKELKWNFNVESGTDFQGAGDSSQQNTLRGSITVVVQKVLPNGLLQIRGDKRLVLNQGEETIRLLGYVRNNDIAPDNTVSSQRIANARIQYFGKGALAHVSQPGWLTRFFNNPALPL